MVSKQRNQEVLSEMEKTRRNSLGLEKAEV